jgi:hypothetical protein
MIQLFVNREIPLFVSCPQQTTTTPDRLIFSLQKQQGECAFLLISFFPKFNIVENNPFFLLINFIDDSVFSNAHFP